MDPHGDPACLCSRELHPNTRLGPEFSDIGGLSQETNFPRTRWIYENLKLDDTSVTPAASLQSFSLSPTGIRRLGERQKLVSICIADAVFPGRRLTLRSSVFPTCGWSGCSPVAARRPSGDDTAFCCDPLQYMARSPTCKLRRPPRTTTMPETVLKGCVTMG